MSVVALGLALIAAWVTGTLSLAASEGYDVAAPLILAPVLVALSLPALIKQARREQSTALLWLLVGALVLKLASALIRDYVAFDVYGNGGDAARYHSDGVRLSEAFRDGNFDTGLPSLTSTDFIRFSTGIIYTVIGTSRLGGFLFYSWLGFWGLFLFYRAFVIAVPEGRPRTYAGLVFFLPSLLFWPSGIGKEAWMLFALGVAAFGAARIFSGATLRGLAVAGVGLWLAGVVRPHVAGMMAIALAASYLLRRSKDEHRQFAPLTRSIAIGVLALAAVYLVVRTGGFLEEAGIDTTGGVTTVVTQVGERTGSGGSEFEPSSVLESPLRAPVGVVTVLFRPFVFEARNVQTLAAAMETAFLLGLFVIRLPWALAAVRSTRRQPFIAFANLYVALFIVGFSGIANFGLLARERVQVLPIYLALFSIPVGKEWKMQSRTPNGSDAWGPRQRSRTTFGRGGPSPDPAERRDVEVDERILAIERRLRGIERLLRGRGGPETSSAHEAAGGGSRSDEAVARRVEQALATLESEAERLLREARSEAEGIVAAAGDEADAIRLRALEEQRQATVAAGRILQEARTLAEQAAEGVSQQRSEVLEDIERLRTLVVTSLEDLGIRREGTSDVALPEPP